LYSTENTLNNGAFRRFKEKWIWIIYKPLVWHEVIRCRNASLDN
jgi:hypothetical protein